MRVAAAQRIEGLDDDRRRADDEHADGDDQVGADHFQQAVEKPCRRPEELECVHGHQHPPAREHDPVEAREQGRKTAVVVAEAIPPVDGLFGKAQHPAHEPPGDDDAKRRQREFQHRLLAALPRRGGESADELAGLRGQVDAAADQPAVVGEQSERDGHEHADDGAAGAAPAHGDGDRRLAPEQRQAPGAPRRGEGDGTTDCRDRHQLDGDDRQRGGDVSRRELIYETERREYGHGTNFRAGEGGRGEERRGKLTSLVLHGTGPRQEKSAAASTAFRRQAAARRRLPGQRSEPLQLVEEVEDEDDAIRIGGRGRDRSPTLHHARAVGVQIEGAASWQRQERRPRPRPR